MTAHFSLDGRRIWVTGHTGMVGSAIVRELIHTGAGCTLLTASSAEVDLRKQTEVRHFVLEYKPDVVILAAATVGGILANDSSPVDFLEDNLLIATNVIKTAHLAKVKKLLFLGSSCMYPREAPQPMLEDQLLTGPLEPTNQWYAVAKLAGMKLCQAYRLQHGDDFITAIPTNLYGPGDNFDLNTSHVVPAVMRKIHDAKIRGDESVTLWGSGKPLREFMHVDDLAVVLLDVLQRYSAETPINVGTGQEVSIRFLAHLVKTIVGYKGEVLFDESMPDGAPRKLLDCRRLWGLGWRPPRIDFEIGLRSTYGWFRDNFAETT